MKYLFFNVFILLCFSLFAQQNKLDSLENLLSQKDGKEKVDLLNELCWQYGSFDIDKSEQFGLQALELAYKLSDSLLIAQVYNDLGTVYYRKSDYDSAIILYQHSLRIRNNEKKFDLAAASNSKIGIAYQEMGKFDLAVKYQLEALRFFENDHDSIKMSQAYNNLARVLSDNHEYKKAIMYDEKALAIFTKFNYAYGMAVTYGSLALSYQDIGEIDKAIDYLEESLSIFKSLKDDYNIATVLLNLGQIYMEKGDTEKRMAYYIEAIELSKRTNDRHTYSMATANLANCYVDLGRIEEAETLYFEALKIASDIKVMQVEQQCFRELSNIYEITGRYKEALEYKSKHFDIHDSIYNIEKFEQLSDLEKKYETEKKEQKIELLKVENEVKQLTIKQQKNLIFAAISGIIFLVIIGLMWYSRKRLQQKAILEAQKNIYRKKLLNSTIEAEEKERKRIARELHDGIAQQLSGLKLAWQLISKDYKGKNLEKIKDITNTLDETADEVRNISHQMMPKVLTTSGLLVALEDALEKAFKYSSIKYQFEHFGVEGRFDEKIELSLYRICQELINNVIKHSEANFVSVQLFKSKNYLILILEDNGKGMNKEKSQDGIGLYNIASRIDTVNGEINYQPSPESGTVATVRVPLIY